MQRHQDAAVGQSDVQRIGAGFFSSDFLVADAGGVVVALSIQDPAVGFQDLDGLGGIIGIGVQSFREQFLGVLVLPHAQAVRTMHHGAVALAELVGELIAVQQVGNSMTHSLELRGAKVALEHQLAVAVTLERADSVAAGVNHIQSGIDLGAVGQLVQHVDGAGLQSVELSLGNSLDADDLLDAGLLALKVAGVVGVDLQDSFASGGVQADQGVGAGRNGMIVDPAGSVDLFGDQLAAVQVSAVAVVLDSQISGSVHGQIQGGQGSVAQLVEVGDIVGADGDGVGVLVQQTDAGELVGAFVQQVAVSIHGVAVGVQHVVAFLILQGFAPALIFGGADNLVGRDLGAGSLGFGRVGNQSVGNEVSSGHGLAVVVGQALVDLHFEGLGAVFVLGGLDAAADGLVDDESAALIGGDGGVVVDQIADVLVVSIVGPPSAGADIAGYAGGGAVDHAVGMGLNSGLFGSGLFRSGLGGRLSGGLSGRLRLGLLAAASEHTQNQHENQHQSQKLCEVGFHLSFPPV